MPEWIRVSDEFYKKLRPRVHRNKSTLKKIKKRDPFNFESFKEATDEIAKHLDEFWRK